jgi:putative membrane protein
MPIFHFLPLLNAIINTTTFVLLIVGLIFILKKKRKIHMRIMWTAFSLSVLFLISYLTLHFEVGEVHFIGRGMIRPIYFTILITHIILAATVVPLVLITLYRASIGNYNKHRKIARWTWPIWLYVSITGVIVYLMLAASGSYRVMGI